MFNVPDALCHQTQQTPSALAVKILGAEHWPKDNVMSKYTSSPQHMLNIPVVWVKRYHPVCIRDIPFCHQGASSESEDFSATSSKLR